MKIVGSERRAGRAINGENNFYSKERMYQRFAACQGKTGVPSVFCIAQAKYELTRA